MFFYGNEITKQSSKPFEKEKPLDIKLYAKTEKLKDGMISKAKGYYDISITLYTYRREVLE